MHDSPSDLRGTLSFPQNSASFSNNLNVLSARALAFASGTNTLHAGLTGVGPLRLSLPSNGLLILRSQSPSYTGSLLITNGTLQVTAALGGTANPNSGATLTGNGVIAGPTTVTGVLAPAGTLTLVATGTLDYELGTTSDLTVVTSNLTLTGALHVGDAGGLTNTT